MNFDNGGMRGQVTVSNDQIVPQPRAFAVRPATTPLNGAAITAWRANSPAALRAWRWLSRRQSLNPRLRKSSFNFGLDSRRF